MSLTMAILMLTGMWVSVATALLWGVMRIVRRHHLHPSGPPKPPRRLRRHINAH